MQHSVAFGAPELVPRVVQLSVRLSATQQPLDLAVEVVAVVSRMKILVTDVLWEQVRSGVLGLSVLALRRPARSVQILRLKIDLCEST